MSNSPADVWMQSFWKYYAEELEVNSQFRQFIVNASLLYGGYNTVGAQLQIKQRWAANKGFISVFVLTAAQPRRV